MAVPLEVVDTFLCDSILEGAHALHHLSFHLGGTVNVIDGQKVLRNWRGEQGYREEVGKEEGVRGGHLKERGKGERTKKKDRKEIGNLEYK